MLKDLRHAVRMLLQAKGWTAVVVLSLALGIGANTALFSAVNGLLLTKIKVSDPDTLVRLRWFGDNDMVTNSSDYGSIQRGPDGLNVRTTFSYPMYQQFVADNKTMSDLFACAPYGRVNVVVDGQAELASAFISSGNYFQVLGVPRADRAAPSSPTTIAPTAPPVAVISSKYWHTRFGTDPSVLGKSCTSTTSRSRSSASCRLTSRACSSRSRSCPTSRVPLALHPQLETAPAKGPHRLAQPTYWWLQVMGRLKPGGDADSRSTATSKRCSRTRRGPGSTLT